MTIKSPVVIDGYSRILKMTYHYMGRWKIFLFSDGSKYKFSEAMVLSQGKADDLAPIHMIKQIFKGEVLSVERVTIEKAKRYRRTHRCS